MFLISLICKIVNAEDDIQNFQAKCNLAFYER